VLFNDALLCIESLSYTITHVILLLYNIILVVCMRNAMKRHSNNNNNVILWEEVDDVCFYDGQPCSAVFQCILYLYSLTIIIIIIVIRQLLENALNDSRGIKYCTLSVMAVVVGQ